MANTVNMWCGASFLHKPWKTLLVIGPALACLCLACRRDYRIERDQEDVWYDNGVGVVHDAGEGWRGRRIVLPGKGAYITIFVRSMDLGLFDGGAVRLICFQLPGDVKEKDRISLRPVRNERQSVTKGLLTYGLMMPGEFVVFCCGHSISYGLNNDDPSSSAVVTIKTVTATTVTIHLKLFASLHDLDSIKMNRTILLMRRAVDPLHPLVYELLPVVELEELLEDTTVTP